MMNLVKGVLGTLGQLKQLFLRPSEAPRATSPAFKEWHQVLEARKTQGKRVIIIGDVHGCIDEFDRLLAKLRYDKGKDLVVLVGDIVAKGPDSLACVRKAQEIGAFSVIGNHDYYVATGSFRENSEHAELAHKILGKEEMQWLSSLPLTLKIEEHNTLVVHAGLDPAKPRPEDTDTDDLLHMRSVTPAGETISGIREDSNAWAKLWKGPPLVVFGHDAVRGLQQEEHAVGLDTGCVYGRQLTALILPSREIVQVDAAKAYKPPG